MMSGRLDITSMLLNQIKNGPMALMSFKLASLLILLLGLTACSTTPPKNLRNSCAIFEEKSGWYDDASNSFKR